MHLSPPAGRSCDAAGTSWEVAQAAYAAGQMCLADKAYDAAEEAGSAALGSIGGASGTGAALAGDMYNRQLHQEELTFLAAKADDYAKEMGISRQEAEQLLLNATLWSIDSASFEKLGGAASGTKYQGAANWLATQAAAVGLTFVNENGQAQQAFTVTGMDQYNDANLFGNPYKGNILTRGIDWALGTELTDSQQISPQQYQDALSAARFQGEYNEWLATKPQDLNNWTEADWTEWRKWDTEGTLRGMTQFGFFGGIGQIATNAADGNYRQIVSDGAVNFATGIPVTKIGSVGGAIEDVAKVAKADIRANKAAGDAFEAEKFKEFQQQMGSSAQQITVKTESGVRTRLDLVGKDGNGAIVCRECKASDTAPLTRNQRIAFPEIEQTGATIVGKGKPGFPGGTTIPPTKVEIVRPVPPKPKP